MTKRRRGTQRDRRPARPGWERTQPVKGTTVSTGIPGLPWLVGGAIVLAVVAVGFILLRPGDGGGTGASPSPSAAHGTNCPTSPPPALPAGETRTVTLNTEKGPIVIKVEADLSPLAAGNFVALASCQFYDGTVFHRVVPEFVIQGGDPEGTGTGGPGYDIQDEPVKATYSRATVAMARGSGPNSAGSQFFIVLDDKAREALAQYNTYQIFGTVTSGMETVDAIAAAADKENPSDPVMIVTATVANP